MATTEQLQARLAALEAARDTGVLTVTHDSKTTTFRSLSEILRIIAILEGQIAASTSTRIRSIRVYTKDGW